jgi:hypothetical protein
MIAELHRGAVLDDAGTYQTFHKISEILLVVLDSLISRRLIASLQCRKRRPLQPVVSRLEESRPHSLIGIGFFRPFGEAIRDEIQSDVVLKKRFEARQRPSESLRRIGHVFDKFVPITRPSRLRNTDEGCAILLRRKLPFHAGESTVALPFDNYSLVRFDGLRGYLSLDVIHFPFPLDLFADFEPTAVLREPKLGRDIWVNEGLEHIRDRSAN